MNLVYFNGKHIILSRQTYLYSDGKHSEYFCWKKKYFFPNFLSLFNDMKCHFFPENIENSNFWCSFFSKYDNVNWKSEKKVCPQNKKSIFFLCVVICYLHHIRLSLWAFKLQFLLRIINFNAFTVYKLECIKHWKIYFFKMHKLELVMCIFD